MSPISTVRWLWPKGTSPGIAKLWLIAPLGVVDHDLVPAQELLAVRGQLQLDERFVEGGRRARKDLVHLDLDEGARRCVCEGDSDRLGLYGLPTVNEI